MKHASPWTSISYVLRGREVRLRASLVYIRGPHSPYPFPLTSKPPTQSSLSKKTPIKSSQPPFKKPTPQTPTPPTQSSPALPQCATGNSSSSPHPTAPTTGVTWSPSPAVTISRTRARPHVAISTATLRLPCLSDAMTFLARNVAAR
ncbi:hypothetical protein M430DRAFT_201315 [Amorphotheca resinae ATCC 22711]|uniref:Uncharacterized protein n=1 Tax=Amorphotheca resinae ATCC 22711 TaxID=857342 RepID=A0A2T3BAL3_AMORE|nr:hypothetical protein M430DRAFT_201315 [Amorphotheca resinae ATCC 22711]PSS25361.1 hypothetical protein M430DRAFT_201315 [Amorphotheca resinae ATCC 22711]